MGTILVFVFGAIVGAILWQWFGLKLLDHVMRHKPVILRNTLQGLNHDAFQRMKREVEAEDLRRKEE